MSLRLVKQSLGLALASLGLHLTALGLAVLGARRTVRLLRSLLFHFKLGKLENGPRFAEALAVLLERAARVCRMRSSCLPRSVLLWCLLNHCGLDARIFIGVQSNAESINAHAWVELDGHALGSDRTGRNSFSALPELSQVLA